VGAATWASSSRDQLASAADLCHQRIAAPTDSDLGAILGPGFATRNAYAGFGLLVLAVAAVGNIQYGTVLAAIIGVTHASSRAVALIRDAQRACTADYLQTTIKKMRWRAVDGLLLLVIAGAAVIAFVQTF
jgi:hypothetical protein